MIATDRTPPKKAPAQIAMVSASRPTGTCRMWLSFATRRISVLTQSSGRLAEAARPPSQAGRESGR